ncbi:MAG: tetratricopeptide repeat protein, partial [Myxococcales bacterium]|nr:tetratricopeptide repeat protein [Myxococcales bacterium]
ELGAEHPVVADVTAAIAASLLRRGEPAKAEELLQVAMMIDARTRGEDHPVSGARLLVHGAALLGLDRRDEARAALERGLAILDAAGATESLARARAHADLGVIARRAGAIEAAIDHHQRAAALFERSLGADDPEVGAQRNALGNLAFARGRNAEARDHYQRALEIKEAALGPDHPGVAGALNNLANAQLELGELAQARALHERALAIFRAQLGERHRLTAHPLTSLAEIAVREQRFADAVTLASRALELREEPDAAKPEERAATRFTLARALWGEGEDPARALALAREAAALLEDVPEGARAQQSTVRAWLAEREG